MPERFKALPQEGEKALANVTASCGTRAMRNTPNRTCICFRQTDTSRMRSAPSWRRPAQKTDDDLDAQIPLAVRDDDPRNSRTYKFLP